MGGAWFSLTAPVPAACSRLTERTDSGTEVPGAAGLHRPVVRIRSRTAGAILCASAVSSTEREPVGEGTENGHACTTRQQHTNLLLPCRFRSTLVTCPEHALPVTGLPPAWTTRHHHIAGLANPRRSRKRRSGKSVIVFAFRRSSFRRPPTTGVAGMVGSE